MNPSEFDRTRLANFGRNVAMDYARLDKSKDKMMEEINAALNAGLTVETIERALLDRCNTRDLMLNVLSVLSAVVKMGELSERFQEVAEDGIMTRTHR